MGRKTILRIFFILITGVLFLFSNAISGNRVINDVNIKEKAGCAIIEVVLNFPIRYDQHFPLVSGDELFIQFEPFAMNGEDEKSLLMREILQPPPSDIADLYEIRFEGDEDNKPLLKLYFNHVVKFKVKQGSDFRSVVVVVSTTGSSSC